MKSFQRLALISTLGVYLLIFVGGLVRVSGAGLGCPDWPKCFGRWVPPLSLQELPAHVDPTTFNVVLAWIEYINRLIGMTVGLLVAATAVMALIHYRKVAGIVIPAVAAALLVAYQGWQGGQVVTSELNPLLVSVHLILALVIVNLLTYATQHAYYVNNPPAIVSAAFPKGTSITLTILWAITFIQVFLGAGVRGTLERLGETFPLASNLELLARSGSLKYIHIIVGVLLAVGVIQIGVQLLRLRQRLSPFLRYSVWWMMTLVAAQVVIGTFLISLRLPALLQLFHLWVAALLLGTILTLITAARYEHRQPTTVRT